ncbi:MAG: polysaccharide pyruvyl transferase family protein [bacterium]
MKRNIYILSASDRYNYGDLLFPIIARKELSKYGDYNFFNIGIVKSDLSEYGALPTYAYKKILSAPNQEKAPVLLIAGGEVLNANWAKLNSFLYPSLQSLFKFLANIERAVNKIIPFSRNPIPFIPVDSRIRNKFHIVFHAVGGRKIGVKRQIPKIKQLFDQSLYISAREKATFNSLQNNFNCKKALLTPDSAILMSDYYNIGPKGKEKFIAFQIGHYKTGNKLDVINKELCKLHEKTKWPIKFIPIGNCPGHDDKISLQWLSRHAQYPCEMVEPENLTVIMQTIAHSELFIGTSLHGIITAMSFGVPYLALNPDIPKLKNYMNTWAPPQMKDITNFEEIEKNGSAVLLTDKKRLLENAIDQKNKARESFSNISRLIQKSR